MGHGKEVKPYHDVKVKRLDLTTMARCTLSRLKQRRIPVNPHRSHDHGATSAAVSRPAPSLNRLAFSATVHCLSGCAVGEVLGMVIGTAFGLATVTTIVLAVVLAFFFGYAFTAVPLMRAGMETAQAARIALAADSASIALMELVDNAIMLVVPGAMDAGLTSWNFWLSLAFALLLAGVAAYPLNRWLLARGLGHALVSTHHRH